MLYLLLQKKKCKNCGKLSHRKVLYCWLCGCSFGYRICVSGHKNPPWVQHCLTCGKDRSLMSKPHVSGDLSFVKHPTKRSYVPGNPRGRQALGWLAVSAGITLLGLVALIFAIR